MPPCNSNIWRVVFIKGISLHIKGKRDFNALSFGDYHPFGDDLVQTKDRFRPWKQHIMKGDKDSNNG